MPPSNLSHRSADYGPSFNIEALTAAAFPHAVSALSVRETHISWVVLTGEFAYKIKKPVRYDFIDASTLELRRQLCEQELRLNQRLAPALYLDTVPITQGADGLRIAGSGPAVEYAVRMRQFDAAAELPQLLAAECVTRVEIMALAESLARFHLRAPRAAAAAESDAPAPLISVLGNLAELLDLLEQTPGTQSLRTLTGWCHEQAAALEPTVQLRARGGFIRECHGDLHAGNIVRYAGRLVPFDCIEFSCALRWIDVLDDLAFLVMDLRSRGHFDLGVALLSRYLEITGDYEGMSLLPFYCVHRALVRAKIDALSLQAQPAHAEDLRRRLVHRLDCALQWTQPSQPMLILMHGMSGSGKSWLSAQLVATLPAIRIRSDVERKRLAGIDTNASAAVAAQQGIYSPHFNHRTYARLADCAEQCLRAGCNVIIDVASLEPANRAVFRDLARTLHATFVIVSCEADPIELASRILERGREHTDPSDASLAVLDAQLRSLQPFDPGEQPYVITVNTGLEVDVAADTGDCRADSVGTVVVRSLTAVATGNP